MKLNIRQSLLVPLSVMLLLGIQVPVYAQLPPTNFPTVASTEIFPRDDVYVFSNDAQFYYQPVPLNMIIDANSRVVLFASAKDFPGERIGWSVDNSYLAFMDSNNSCVSFTDEGNLILFNTQNREISRLCIPYHSSGLILQWSPFAGNILAFIGPNQLFNVETLEFTPFTFQKPTDANQLRNYVGYNQYLWDPVTQMPGAAVFLNDSIDYGATSVNSSEIAGDWIEQSVLEACSNECIQFVDTLSVANNLAYRWYLNGQWLLWESSESTTGNPVLIHSYSERADTAIYLTNIASGETQELFRFSSLGLTDIVPTFMGWSPDGRTIAMDLEEVNPSEDFLPTPDPTCDPCYRHGSLLIHLDWN
jgi:hypothetical protein